MTLVRLYALKCNACPATCVDARLPRARGRDDAEKFRRWTRRHGWRRTAGRDLCPTCSADDRIRARLASRPRGMF